MGGFGSAVLETLHDLNITIPVARVGYADKFMEHASTNKEIQDKYGLSAAAALTKTRELLAEVATGTTKPRQFRVLGTATANARPA
jgi:deoxyxylulose-5-phosphate synthase